MKTPREILLKRHRSVEPKLDRLWDKTLTPELQGGSTLARSNTPFEIGWKLWSELILPYRRIWTGLACAWALIVVLDVASAEPERQVAARPERRSPEELQAVIEQRRMLAQMIEPLPEPVKARHANPPGPRSERVARTTAV